MSRLLLVLVSLNLSAATCNLVLLVHYGYYWAIGVGYALLVIAVNDVVFWMTSVKTTFGKVLAYLSAVYSLFALWVGYFASPQDLNSPFLCFIVYLSTSYMANLLIIVLIMVQIPHRDVYQDVNEHIETAGLEAVL